MDDSQVPLADAIRALRQQLSASIREGEGQDLRFQMGTVELQLQLDLSREVGGEAGASFWVVSVGAKGSSATTSRHSVKLTMEPVTSGGAAILVETEVPKRPD